MFAARITIRERSCVLCLVREMDVPDLSGVLLAGGTESNEALRREAERVVMGLLESNYPLAVFALTNEIATEGKNKETRRIAGAVLKNAINGGENGNKGLGWKNLDGGVRETVKTRLLHTLSSPERFKYFLFLSLSLSNIILSLSRYIY